MKPTPEPSTPRQRSVLGEPLVTCSNAPLTGFFRDGCCNTDETDRGRHVVCAVMTDAFLAYSRKVGNDLSTPRPEHGFAGLRAGDRWCLCGARWKQALEAGCAPHVVMAATHESMLELVPLDALMAHALDVH
jgi:uncharacterized protein (DUF2237 family)